MLNSKQNKILWYQRHLRISAFCRDPKTSVNETISIWKDYKFNCVILGMTDKKYIKEAHKNGLKIICYFNVHILPIKVVDENPDLVARDKDGKPIVMYNPNYVLNCITKPYQDWSYEKIKNLVEQLDIDGLFLDGPITPEDGCYCKNCRELFKERFGYELDKVSVTEKQHRKNLIEFNISLVNEYLDRARKILKSIKPDAILYMNAQGLSSGRKIGRDNRIQIQYQDMLGAEGGYIYYEIPNKVPLWKSGATSKLLQSQSGGKPTVIFMAGDHKPWNRYFLTPAETQLYYLDAVANGSNIWYGFHDVLSKKDFYSKACREVKKLNSFISKNEEYYSNTKSAAGVAILFSLLNDENCRRAVLGADFTFVQPTEKERMYGNFWLSFSGYYEILLRSQIPFDVIDDESLYEDVKKYKMIIIPNCGCCSEKFANALRKYVSEGGNIIAQFDTSLFNEDGEILNEFQLSDLFGISFNRNFHRYFTSSYFSFVKSLPYLSQDLIPAPEYVIEVKPTTAEVLAKYHNPMPGQYYPLEGHRYPAILKNKFGKGNVYYFAGTFGELYWDYRLHDYRKIISEIVNNVIGRKIILRNNPQSIEVILREKTNKIFLLHLINFSNDGSRPIESIIPVYNIEVELIEFGKIKSIKNLFGAKKLKRKSENTFVIPRLDIYEIIKIELI